MEPETLAPEADAAERADAARRLALMIRADLLSIMRMLDQSETRKAHARAAYTVAALDDVLAELEES